jgi:hypothetical protein
MSNMEGGRWKVRRSNLGSREAGKWGSERSCVEKIEAGSESEGSNKVCADGSVFKDEMSAWAVRNGGG